MEKKKRKQIGISRLLIMFLIIINTCYVLPRLEDSILQRFVAFTLLIYVISEVYKFISKLGKSIKNKK